MASCQYRKSHCRDKTILRSSYLHNGISYTGYSWILDTPILILRSSYLHNGISYIGYSWILLYWSYDRLISTMGFPILVRCHLYIESAPCLPWHIPLQLFISIHTRDTSQWRRSWVRSFNLQAKLHPRVAWMPPLSSLTGPEIVVITISSVLIIGPHVAACMI